jgi:hypothetical protein
VALKLTRKKSPGDAGEAAVRKQKSPPGAKAFKTRKGSRFVLFIGDEGAILVHLKDRLVISRQFVPDAGQQNLDELGQTLSKDPKAPILMVVDSMDQSYVQQTLPPVSSMSVGKLIKRRLDRDLAGNDIKGAILLGREKTGRKDWNFMMIAQERSPQLNLWLEYVQELPNRFEGIRLVSVEAEHLLRSMDRAQGKGSKENPGAEWKFFVSHNKVGGFRQVILRHGRIVFTRLAQPMADANTEVVAGSIEQEMLSTIEYMKRLSYNAQSGLDIVIVASQAIKESVDYRKFGATSVQSFTPFELSQLFGIEGATQPADQFGDVVLAALIGASGKHVLALDVPQFKKINQCYQIIGLQRLAAVLVTIGLIGFAGYTGFNIYTLSNQIDKLQKDKEVNQRTLTALREEIKRTNLDVEKATDLIDLYRQLKKENVNPFEFIEKLKPLIVAPISLKSIEWTVSDTRPTSPSSGNEQATPAPPAGVPAAPPAGATKWIMVSLVIELPGIATDTRKRIAIMNKIIRDFSEHLNGYEVTADKSLIDQARQQEQNRKLSSSRNRQEPAQPVAPVSDQQTVEEKIFIIGPLIPPKPSPSTVNPVPVNAPPVTGATP